MSLIPCPNCGKEISDKAITCPSCGASLEEVQQEVVEEKTKIICEDCGTEYENDLAACPNCGCPKPEEQLQSQEQPVKKKMSKTRKKIIGICCAIAVVLIVVFGIIIYNSTVNNANSEYNSKYKQAYSTMYRSTKDADKMIGLIQRVWHDAIYKSSDEETSKYINPDGYHLDFNEAVKNVYFDDDNLKIMTSIEKSQKTVKNLIKEMKNPSDDNKESYDCLKDTYDCYLKFTNLALDASGNLNSYSEQYNDLETDIKADLDKMENYIDD